MDEVNERHLEPLTDCLQMLDAGADAESCLARHPEHADGLRPYLELRSELLGSDAPPPPSTAYQAGRQALLERAAPVREPGKQWSIGRLGGLLRGRWNRLPSPLARAAAVGVALILLGGGALGASAGAGFDPARDVLTALNIVDDGEDMRGDDLEAAGPDATATEAAPGPTPGPTARTAGAPEEVPGVGLCFAEGVLQNIDRLPAGLLERVPDDGLCIPEGLLERTEKGAACLPPGIARQFEDVLEHPLGDLPLCGSENGSQAPDVTAQQPDVTPPDERPGRPDVTVPAPIAPPGLQPTEKRVVPPKTPGPPVAPPGLATSTAEPEP